MAVRDSCQLKICHSANQYFTLKVWIFPQEPHSFPYAVNTFISILNSPVKLCFTKDALSTQEAPLAFFLMSDAGSLNCFQSSKDFSDSFLTCPLVAL